MTTKKGVEAVKALRAKAGRRLGFVRAVLSLEPEHLTALQALAIERAAEFRAPPFCAHCGLPGAAPVHGGGPSTHPYAPGTPPGRKAR